MRSLILLLTLAALSGCGWKGKVKRLASDEVDHYYALRVFMEEDQKKEYLTRKTQEERDEYLKELGLWDRFYKYDAGKREAIVTGEVRKGWTKEMLLMAWGMPYEARKLPGRKAERSELFLYRFEQMSDGAVLVWTPDSKTYYKASRLFVKEVTLDDDVITELEEKESHW